MSTAPRAARRETEAKEPRSPRRVSLPQRPGGSNIISDTISELKKVVWPTRDQTINLSLIVLVASLIVGVILGATDWVFTQIIERFLAI